MFWPVCSFLSGVACFEKPFGDIARYETGFDGQCEQNPFNPGLKRFKSGLEPIL
jgi:hypothetical protein